MAAKVILFMLSTTFIEQSSAQFNLQYLGKYVTLENEKTRDFCDTKLCLMDQNDLFYSATQKATVDPCSDFKEFALGTFIKYRALNDRYAHNGFADDVQHQHDERRRKVLAEKVDETKDSRVFKIMKNSFEKCVTSNNVKLNGTTEMHEYLKSLGSSPYLSGTFWDLNNFNLSRIFYAEPDHAISLFLDHKLQKCQHPVDLNLEILCFKYDISWNDTSLAVINDTINMLIEMKRNIQGQLTESEIESLVKEAKTAAGLVQEFYKLKSLPEQESDSLNLKLVRINDMRNLLPLPQVNWLKIINDQLLNSSKMAEGDFILIENFELMEKLMKLLSSTENSILAETFAMTLMFYHRWLFIVYRHNEIDELMLGTTKAVQRWEQCLAMFRKYTPSAIESIYSTKYRDKNNEKAAEKFVNEIVEYFSKYLIKKTENSDREDAAERIRRLKLIVGLPEEILNEVKLEIFYEELQLNGQEKIVKSYFEMCKFHRKLEIENDWRWKFEKLSVQEDVYYSATDNVLYVPSKCTHYPWFHSNRSRFFNTATLTSEVLGQLNLGLKDFYKTARNSTNINFDADDNIQIAYENYVEWEADDERELQLGANLLTNRQLYWMATARRMFSKYHQRAPAFLDPIHRLQDQFLHVYLKSKQGFQDAFECGMTGDENSKFQEYLQKFDELFSS